MPLNSLRIAAKMLTGEADPDPVGLNPEIVHIIRETERLIGRIPHAYIGNGTIALILFAWLDGHPGKPGYKRGGFK